MLSISMVGPCSIRDRPRRPFRRSQNLRLAPLDAHTRKCSTKNEKEWRRGTSFKQSVWTVLKKTSYAAPLVRWDAHRNRSHLADACGKNPSSSLTRESVHGIERVPWHRVVCHDGSIGEVTSVALAGIERRCRKAKKARSRVYALAISKMWNISKL